MRSSVRVGPLKTLNRPIREHVVFLLIEITVKWLLVDKGRTMRKRVFNPLVLSFTFLLGEEGLKVGRTGVCGYLKEGRPREQGREWEGQLLKMLESLMNTTTV